MYRIIGTIYLILHIQRSFRTCGQAIRETNNPTKYFNAAESMSDLFYSYVIIYISYLRTDFMQQLAEKLQFRSNSQSQMLYKRRLTVKVTIVNESQLIITPQF